ncbi:MAG: hypothetical protein ACRDWB_03845, partial [Acidimicrobiales bacterium]
MSENPRNRLAAAAAPLLLIASLTLVGSGRAGAATPSPSPAPSSRLHPATSSRCQNVVADESGWVNCMLNAMSVPERVGQLFVLNAYGTSATD